MPFTLDEVDEIAGWHGAGLPVVLVSIASVAGSAPRDADAAMAVARDAIAGTIGGGQLEWRAIAQARAILEGHSSPGELDIPLGPELGQCCGGRVRLAFSCLDAALLARLQDEANAAAQRLPHVLVFGAGHTGTALARALSPLPLNVRLIDTRPDVFAGLSVETVVTALPEDAVRGAPPGSAFVAMTHEHALDFLIVAEALKRGDAAYVGMIGSATKRAVFANWLGDNGPHGGYGRALAANLVCPIGGSLVKDKRPAVIAALTAAEILAALSGRN